MQNKGPMVSRAIQSHHVCSVNYISHVRCDVCSRETPFHFLSNMLCIVLSLLKIVYVVSYNFYVHTFDLDFKTKYVKSRVNENTYKNNIILISTPH